MIAPLLVLFAALLVAQAKKISPIELLDKGETTRGQYVSARVWFTAEDQTLPHILNDQGLYASTKPGSYELVASAPGSYTIASPLAAATMPNTFSLSTDKNIATIVAMDLLANKTYWTTKVKFDSSAWQRGTPVIYATLDGTLIVFVSFKGSYTDIRFYDGASGTEVQIQGAGVSTAVDLGSWRFYPTEHHMMMIYYEISDSTVRWVEGPSKKVLFSTPFDEYDIIFLNPSSILFSADYHSKASLLDLGANTTTRLAALDDVRPRYLTHIDAQTLAVANKNMIRTFDLAKGMFLPGNWSVPGDLEFLEENGTLAMYNGDKEKYYVANFATNKTWELDHNCNYCDGGYIIRNTHTTVPSPSVAVLNNCNCKHSWNTLVYQIPDA